MGGLFGTVLLMNLAIPPLMVSRPALYRELDAGFFASESWSLATTIVEVPWVAFLVAIYSPIFYFMMGFEPEQFGWFYGAVFLMGFFFCMVGHTFSAFSPSQQLATVALTIIMSIQSLFGGFLIPGPQMADGFVWLHYVVPLRYGIGGLLAPVVYCKDPPSEGLPLNAPGPCSSVTVVLDGERIPNMPKATFIDEFYGFTMDDIEFYFGMLAGFAGFMVVVKLLAVKFIRHQSR